MDCFFGSAIHSALEGNLQFHSGYIKRRVAITFLHFLAIGGYEIRFEAWGNSNDAEICVLQRMQWGLMLEYSSW